MKLTEKLKSGKLSLSFEVFPPKTDTSFESVKTATEEIAKLSPSFMSVTYGAGGGTSAYTLDIAKNIKETYGVPTLAHLTCVSSGRETVKKQIAEMKAAGIENVMALRGDLTPQMKESGKVPGDYRYASELIAELKGQGFTPKFTPKAETKKRILLTLKRRWKQAVSSLQHKCFLTIIFCIIFFIKSVRQE